MAAITFTEKVGLDDMAMVADGASFQEVYLRELNRLILAGEFNKENEYEQCKVCHV